MEDPVKLTQAKAQIDTKYLKKRISTPLLECLVQTGMKYANIGPTFQADHALPDGNVAESSIDHVYYCVSMEEEISYKKMGTSSSDHLPVITNLKISERNKTYLKKIKKRSMKNFTAEKWMAVLESKQWNLVNNETTGVDGLADNFDSNIEECLNELAPYKINSFIHSYT